MRRFNVTGSCNPQRDYMVGLGDRLRKIKEDFVDEGSYFVINRGRQYGKTTTLRALGEYLKEDYIVVSLDFQQLGAEDFADVQTFVRIFVKKILTVSRKMRIEDKELFEEMLAPLSDSYSDTGLNDLFERLSSLCENAARSVVLIIDEVDSAGNNQLFIEFLAQLRSYYLNRDQTPTFHSVILAGVYSVKNLKLKIRPESKHQYNSPWNIAAKFNVRMDFPAGQIAGMLEEYEADHHIGMDVQAMAEEIYQYTAGYPVLVSSICKYLDEELPDKEGFGDLGSVWTKEGIGQAVKNILKEGMLLFESMAKQLDTYKEQRDMIEDILYRGRRIPFSPEQKSINLGVMFGFLKEADGQVAVANRMFEMCLLNLFLAEESRSDVYVQGESDRIQFIKDDRLDMDLVLKKFVEYFDEIYGSSDVKFIEAQGRRFFLLYLKPIINGAGNYYIEAQTRDARRTDVIVDYHGEQFIVELKIWHGNEYNERGEKQITDYLEYYHKDKGYLLSFNFNKNKKTGVNEIRIGNKTVVEAVV